MITNNRFEFRIRHLLHFWEVKANIKFNKSRKLKISIIYFDYNKTEINFFLYK